MIKIKVRGKFNKNISTESQAAKVLDDNKNKKRGA